MITDFVTIYKNTITGKFDSKRYANSNPSGKRELSGGAKIKLHFFGLYQQFANFNATSEYTDADIETAVMLHEGDTIQGFPSVDVFIYLIQPQLEKLREPALALIQDIYHMLENMAKGIVERIFARFPSMIQNQWISLSQFYKMRERKLEVLQILQLMLNKIIFLLMIWIICKINTSLISQSFVEIELIQYSKQIRINNNNSGQAHRTRTMEKLDKQPITWLVETKTKTKDVTFSLRKLGLECRFIQCLRIDAYLKLVVRNRRNTIPKSIGYFLVKASQARLQFELYAQINKNEQLTKQLDEPEKVTEERKALNATLDTLKKAIKVLQRDPNITNTTFGEDELEEELRLESIQKRKEQEEEVKRRPVMADEGHQMNSVGSFKQEQGVLIGCSGQPRMSGGMKGMPQQRQMPPGGGAMQPGEYSVPPGGGIRPQGQNLQQPLGQQPQGRPGGTGNLFGNNNGQVQDPLGRGKPV